MAKRPSLYPNLLALVLGVVLITQAFPRLVGGLQLSDQDDFLPKLYRWVPSAPPPHAWEVHLAGERWQRAAMHVRDGTLRAELGNIRMAQRDVSRDAAFRSSGLAAAIRAYSSGLVRYPAQPYAWMGLARALYLRDGPQSIQDSLLKMAIRTAPREPSLFIFRIEHALSTWRRLRQETRNLVRDQIVLAARWRPDDLARLARRRFALKTVRESLKNAPDALDRFDQAWRQLTG